MILITSSRIQKKSLEKNGGIYLQRCMWSKEEIAVHSEKTEVRKNRSNSNKNLSALIRPIR